MSHENIISMTLTHRQICDIELLLNGGFSPLSTFLGKKDYESVLESGRLNNGTLWPIPIMLDVSEEILRKISEGTRLILCDSEGIIIAEMKINEIWHPNFVIEAESIYGTKDVSHPGVDYLFNHTYPIYISGPLKKVQSPVHYDYLHLRDSPTELKEKFHKWGWSKVIGFQTRNPMHRAHFELTIRAANSVNANLLIHPVVGMTLPGDIDYFTRVRCYEHLLKYYPEQTVALSLLPLAMRMAGPKEALWHAIIRKNYGCSHFIVGRDHASPGSDRNGKNFYDPYEAHKLVSQHSDEIGIVPVMFREMVYLPSLAEYREEKEIPPGSIVETISGTEVRRRLQKGIDLPNWFTFPEVSEELKKAYPPLKERGFAVFFTGLSGSGKSTTANILKIKLRQIKNRYITILDGDTVRKNLSSELGFSREHRDLNIKRIGYVASEIVKQQGIVICAQIAPFESARKYVKDLITPHGGFLLVYLKTPLDICESRDRKNIYLKAKSGEIPDFTGISSPYEEPVDPDLAIDTTFVSPSEAAMEIILKLKEKGFLE